MGAELIKRPKRRCEPWDTARTEQMVLELAVLVVVRSSRGDLGGGEETSCRGSLPTATQSRVAEVGAGGESARRRAGQGRSASFHAALWIVCPWRSRELNNGVCPGVGFLFLKLRKINFFLTEN